MIESGTFRGPGDDIAIGDAWNSTGKLIVDGQVSVSDLLDLLVSWGSCL